MIRRAGGWAGYRALVAVVLVAASAGCFASATPSPFRGAEDGRGRIEIRVDNISFNDATLFVVTPSRRIRLGVVAGKGSRTFNVDWADLQDMQIEIDLLASRRFVSQTFSVASGQSFQVQVQEPVGNSLVTLSNRR